MLSPSEVAHLEKLSALKLDPSQRAQFTDQLESIITFIGKLQDFSFDPHQSSKSDHMLQPFSEQTDYGDSDGLLQNVQHPILDHMIQIKSSLE